MIRFTGKISADILLKFILQYSFYQSYFPDSVDYSKMIVCGFQNQQFRRRLMCFSVQKMLDQTILLFF